MEERLARAPVGVLDVTPDGTVTALNDSACDLLDVDRETAVDSQVDAVVPESVENRIPRVFETGFDETRFEEYYPGPDQWVEVSLVETADSVTVYLVDVTDSYRVEQRFSQLEGDIDRLTIINELISEILAELVAASSREEIAETICTRLGETEIYEFAWVGEREVGGDDIVVRAAAGTTGRTFEEIGTCLDDSVTVPEQRVFDTGEPVIVQPLGQDTSVPERIRRAAFADGVQSLLAVPLSHGTSVYGVVGIYAADQDAFSERERTSFATLGEMAGFAVNATRHRNLLLSDTVVELRVELRDRQSPLVAGSDDTDGTLSVEGLVPQGEQLLCYLTVSETTPEALTDTVESADAVTAARTIAETDSGGSLELTLTETAPLARLVSLGVTFQSASFDDGVGTVVVEVPPEEEVRRIGDTLTREFDASIMAKREQERSITSPSEFRDQLSDRLTAKQENALRTAFFADYFESPRGSSAQEVAGALDITGPTLLHHLRAGQRKLLAEFFDVGDADS